MPPVAIVVGPREMPVGENGCLARATRSRPSLPAYFRVCASAGDHVSSAPMARAPPIRNPAAIVKRQSSIVNRRSSQRVVSSRRRPRDGCRCRFRREILAWIDEPIALEAVLLVVQLPIAPAGGEQLVVRAPLHDFSVLEHAHLIGPPDRRQPL